MSVASEDMLFPPVPLCLPVSEGEAAACSCEVSTAIYKVQRIATQSIQDTWDVLLAEDQIWLHPDFPSDSASVSYLYPTSGFPK